MDRSQEQNILGIADERNEATLNLGIDNLLKSENRLLLFTLDSYFLELVNVILSVGVVVKILGFE